MSRPQQAHDANLDNLTSGEIVYDSASNGQHRLRYRTIEGIKRQMVKGSPEVVWLAYLEAVADLQATAKEKYLKGETW